MEQTSSNQNFSQQDQYPVPKPAKSPEETTKEKEGSDSVNKMQEQVPVAGETLSNNPNVANQNQGMVLPPVLPDPQPAQTPNDPSSVNTAGNDNTSPDDNSPVIADDVDVIEKEWVDKAKQIVNETKDDPYRQEEEVEKLQRDYLKKRYGKEIKSSN